ncbi:MAG: DegT/DnrJ/EryC1/StrS family aminotransferase [Anaerolineae bacterium]|nr:DegT/DnrJ/EryC1/StrS family aminotransferase [Anaerolineae bacterium]
MLKPVELDLSELGELAQVIPGPEPKLELSLSPIPQFGAERPRIIPVCEPSLTGNELKYVTDCIESNWISSAGHYIQAFERAFAAACQVRYGISCCSGTIALHLALAVLGLQPGDEVIIPTFTMIATAYAVTYTGARPVLVDSERETWNMDLDQVEARITPRTRAIIPVHTYGHPVDMDRLNALAERHGLWVIEDAAEAHGALYKGRPTGSLGDAAAFSFYANKIITTGEGGMLVTDNEELARLAWTLRDHAFSSERHFWHKFIGYSYRMTNLQAAVGLAQVEQMANFVAARRANAAYYTELLKDIPGLVTPPQAEWATSVYWMYGILVQDEFGLTRDELRRRLAQRGIETRTFFIPMHLQPIYYEMFKGERYPVAEDFCRRGLYLPSASSLTRQEIERVVDTLRDVRR